MTRTGTPNKKPRVRCVLRLFLVFGLLVAGLAFLPQRAFAGTSASDDFNRADGSLGANWTDMSDGGLAISSQVVTGTHGTAVSGDMWAAGTFTSDQYSQIQVTSTPLSGGQWIGAAVRAQSGGLSAYVGLYFWNSGSPELMLFLRNGGNWTQLGNAYNSGPLAAGTQLEVTAVGGTIALLENGVQRVAVSNSSLTGGAPGIMAYGTATADNWSGGGLSFYSVGGTVSGLSGTVVLQDNGGNDLSVSSNGSFTFSAQLADGASYNVTVKTYPTGQTCTVSGGSGTIASASVTSVSVSCTSSTATSGSDDFNRADGGLGPDWTDMSDGGLAISSQQVTGTAGSGISGDIWTANAFTSDQQSEFQVTSTPLSGGQWIGAAVRAQSGGQSAYAGLYFWNSGSPELMLFRRNGGSWTQLGNAYNSGTLPAGTRLEVTAAGNNIAFLENGIQRIAVSDSSLTGGAPGIIAYGTATADNWSGGNASTGSFSVGGTVSGLSGTVVLQDNGGDDLSVSSNGSFTFSAQLADGASYNVTVKAYPAGQTCTVSGGSGTIASASVTNVAVSCASSTATSGSDDFNRADGGLGPDWTDMSDGGLAISSQQVTGTAGSGISGDIRTAETYPSDQFSQFQVTSTPLSGGQWIGAAVRAQSGGQSAYAGLYFWNNGNPELVLFLRNGGNWSELGSPYNCGTLTAGTQLRLVAVGNTVAFLENGVERIAVGDSTLTGGAPGIIAYGTTTADNWSGGPAGFQVNPLSTTGSGSLGVKRYDIISANNGYGPQPLRVLTPTNPAQGVAHNFLIVLPVEPELGTTYGDGLGTLQTLDAQDKYNLTIIEPSFATGPWYADNPTLANIQYETFMTQELVPWIKQNLATSGSEQIWLLGFSKSGIGGQDLILKHPDLFTLAATWDFPADMSTYNQYGDSASSYGTDANFQANYRLTATFVNAHAAPFKSANRMWIGGYSLYQTDMSDYNTLLTSAGVLHTTETPQYMAHRWDSGWVPIAMSALYQDSLHLSG